MNYSAYLVRTTHPTSLRQIQSTPAPPLRRQKIGRYPDRETWQARILPYPADSGLQDQNKYQARLRTKAARQPRPTMSSSQANGAMRDPRPCSAKVPETRLAWLLGESGVGKRVWAFAIVFDGRVLDQQDAY
ncbi:predicted protein [Plenodomus lingam JN3]|uniref:Predicted protein n=1 Tax=Leptosphaeria maculans (strain JN3 / isolate v23.1.3 / race Av1-4-5-6-7-8) TaxID=985895 RepID=E4ZV57_LEPMJ|nr:predicted protein [Plenodomus lingam JN3]CBX95483.1 predicted protein [Plenodomus lingam JN3]